MDKHYVHGIDASNYQGFINWKQVKESGREFAYVKATEGLLYQDSTFNHNWYGMEHQKFIRGAYHLLHYDLDGRAQADYHHAYVRHNGHYKVNDYCVVDFERLGTMSTATAVQCLVEFVERALDQIAKQVICYMDRWLWEELGNPHIPVLNNRPLIVPEYGPNPPTVIPGWPIISFWQNSDEANVPGVMSKVDTDVFFGTREQLLDVVKFTGK